MWSLIILLEKRNDCQTSCEYEYGIDYSGSDLKNVPNWPPKVSSPEVCQQMCDSNDECTHFTFHPSSGACFPKHGDITCRDRGLYALSGRKFCKVNIKIEFLLLSFCQSVDSHSFLFSWKINKYIFINPHSCVSGFYWGHQPSPQPTVCRSPANIKSYSHNTK